MAILSYMVHHPGHTTAHQYKRFCENPVVVMTAEGPTLTVCGRGYKKKGRKNKDIPYCGNCLKSTLNKGRYRSWETTELVILKDYYARVPFMVLAKMLPRHTKTAIRSRAQYLGIQNRGTRFV